MSQTHLSQVRFDSLQIAEPVLKGIQEAGFETCTPIQAETLPVALRGADVAGQAQTGTGKTAAFLVAIFHHLLQTRPMPNRRPCDPRAVVLAPTRELAIQIHKDAEALNRHCGFSLALAYGGTDYEKQRRKIEQGVDVLVGTPGRIIDYARQGVFSFGCAQVAVLDEADRMFDLGFIKDIRFVLRRMPPADQRMNMLFSATLSQRVLELAYEHMNEPKLVRIDPEQITPERIRQIIYFPSNREKIPLLVSLLRHMDPRRTMIFVNRRREADRLQRYLEANGVHAQAISGDVPQTKRQRLLREFQSGDLPVLIGTDVASRGLHIPDVSHVFNFDLPDDAEDYVHRVGRTARAGAYGDAISFGCEDYAQNLPAIEEFVGYKIPVEAIDSGSLPDITIPPRPPRRPDNKRPPRQGAPRRGPPRGGRKY